MSQVMPQTPLERFHPAVAAWFRRRFQAPTAAQARAWPSILDGRSTLVAAPTGSGKTLAAFLAAIDGLLRQLLAGRLEEATQVVYVSPLKALSNDIERNLQEPLAGISEELVASGLAGSAPIRVLVRTGDTPAKERTAMLRRPPHILVTTPESLYILLTSAGGRRMLRTTRTVIVDEIHALIDDKRGSHLALSLERLEALARGTRAEAGETRARATMGPLATRPRCRAPGWSASAARRPSVPLKTPPVSWSAPAVSTRTARRAARSSTRGTRAIWTWRSSCPGRRCSR
jgi:ATP-dependent Lhr-like helicase